MNVAVTQNSITNGNGAGIAVIGANNTVTLDNSDVTSNVGNCAGCDGGGISNAGTLNITNGSAINTNSSFNPEVGSSTPAATSSSMTRP